MSKSVSRPDAVSFPPLSPQVFQILLSLHDGASHGYAIIQDIQERTRGEIRLTASTLYDALARLVDQALIEEADGPGARANRATEPVARDDARRRYYELTARGRDVAALEARRLERLLASARAKWSTGPSRPRR